MTLNGEGIPVPEERPFVDEDDNDQEDRPRTVVDIDGNEVKRISMGHQEFREFGRLLIEAFFFGNIREGASDEVREEIFGEIEAVCLLRGFDAFVNDVEKLDGDLARVLQAYSRRVVARVQDAANALYAREKQVGIEGLRNPGDRAILDFCKRHGVKHMPDRPGDLQGLINQLAEMMGVPQEKLNEIRQSIEDGGPTPGCNCERCTAIREERGESPIVDERDDDEETISL